MTGLTVPLEVAAVLCAAVYGLGFWTARRQTKLRLYPARNPVTELLRPANLGPAIDLAARRDAVRSESRSILHGRIDQLAAHGYPWDFDTREQVREHVMAVMRAGMRRGDHFTVAPSGVFTIDVPGADERAAVRIADRLRHSLARLRLAQLGKDARLTASFGVATERFGDTGDTMVRRARRALEAAVSQGEDVVVPASEIDDVILLPAPGALPSASAA